MIFPEKCQKISKESVLGEREKKSQIPKDGKKITQDIINRKTQPRTERMRPLVLIIVTAAAVSAASLGSGGRKVTLEGLLRRAVAYTETIELSGNQHWAFIH